MTTAGWRPRGRPHLYREDAATPGVCHRCPLPRRNGVHDPERVAEAEQDVHEGQVLARQTTGEREEEP